MSTIGATIPTFQYDQGRSRLWYAFAIFYKNKLPYPEPARKTIIVMSIFKMRTGE